MSWIAAVGNFFLDNREEITGIFKDAPDGIPVDQFEQMIASGSVEPDGTILVQTRMQSELYRSSALRAQYDTWVKADPDFTHYPRSSRKRRDVGMKVRDLQRFMAEANIAYQYIRRGETYIIQYNPPAGGSQSSAARIVEETAKPAVGIGSIVGAIVYYFKTRS